MMNRHDAVADVFYFHYGVDDDGGGGDDYDHDDALGEIDHCNDENVLSSNHDEGQRPIVEEEQEDTLH
jgi:hypothetical protein